MSQETPSPDNFDELYKNPIVPQPSAQPSLISNRYKLLELIGRGATSRIYRAKDLSLDRVVAIKLLREEYQQDQTSLARFRREAQAVAGLASQHIVQVYDYGEYEGTYFIVMQYIEGANLKELVQRDGLPSPEGAVSIIKQVLIALDVAHSGGVIHRDVKPQNILVQAKDGQVKLADFGVAHTVYAPTLTTLGTVIGTMQYMAPEQVNGGAVSPATDLYSTGVVLYELLAGRLPFEGTNQMQVALQHLYDPPPDFASLGRSVPPALERVVRQALAKTPSQRYQTARQMRTALAQAVVTAPPAPTRSGQAVPVAPIHRESVSMRPVARSRWPLLVSLALLLLLVVGLGWVGFNLLTDSNSKNPAPVSPVANATVAATAATTTIAGQSSPAAGSNPTNPTQPPKSAATEPPGGANNGPEATSLPQPITRATSPPTVTPVREPTTTLAAPVPSLSAGTPGTFSPYTLAGAYKRDDGTLFGRPTVALYGQGSTYEQGTVNFKLNRLQPGKKVVLRLTGLDDERLERCQLQVLINGTKVFDAPNTFPNVPNTDNGIGGPDRRWGTMDIPLPASVLTTDQSTLTLRNATPWNGNLGIPYILINSVEFVEE